MSGSLCLQWQSQMNQLSQTGRQSDRRSPRRQDSRDRQASRCRQTGARPHTVNYHECMTGSTGITVPVCFHWGKSVWMRTHHSLWTCRGAGVWASDMGDDGGRGEEEEAEICLRHELLNDRALWYSQETGRGWFALSQQTGILCLPRWKGEHQSD